MIKIRSTQQIIYGFLAFALFSFLYSEKIVEFVSALSPLLILVVVPLLNPIYLIFIGSLWSEYGFKGVLSGYIIAIAITIVSIPHIILKSGEVSNESYFSLVADVNVWEVIPNFLKFDIFGVNFGSVLLYLGISTLLMILALMLMHKKKFRDIFLKTA